MQNNEQENKPSKPNEEGQILIDEHVKIFDPATGEVILDKRESN